MTVKFHMGWFVDSFRCPAWNQQWSGSSEHDWMQPGFFVDMAKNMERAKFDFIFFADSTDVGYEYMGTPEIYLKHAQNAPRLDPTALAPILSYETTHLGVVPTITTTEWHPFHMARFLSSADHMSRGRMGWNLVTGGHRLASDNFGSPYINHDERYDMADEYVELCTKLWNSWEPGAVVRNHETGYYADHTKVHTVDYEGKYYSCRGPMTMPTPPQGRPVIAQAGSSPRGREFAAQHADMIVGTATTVEKMREYRNDIHARMSKYGRKPGDIKILFLAVPVIAETDAAAEERMQQIRMQMFEINISVFSRHFNFDMSQFDPDKPLPAGLSTEGHAGCLKTLIDTGKTVREMFTEPGSQQGLVMIGSPDTIAAKMEEMMQAVGGDGFLIYSPWVTRRLISEVTDGLIPALQARGVVRTEYEHAHFRDNLLAF